jgi:hypothetical protein
MVKIISGKNNILKNITKRSELLFLKNVSRKLKVTGYFKIKLISGKFD